MKFFTRKQNTELHSLSNAVHSDLQKYKCITLQTIHTILKSNYPHIVVSPYKLSFDDLAENKNHFPERGILTPSMYIIKNFIGSLDDMAWTNQNTLLSFLQNNSDIFNEKVRTAINHVALTLYHQQDCRLIFQNTFELSELNTQDEVLTQAYWHIMLLVLRLNTLYDELAINDTMLSQEMVDIMPPDVFELWLTIVFERSLHGFSKID